jgi:hypothetical protein
MIAAQLVLYIGLAIIIASTLINRESRPATNRANSAIARLQSSSPAAVAGFAAPVSSCPVQAAYRCTSSSLLMSYRRSTRSAVALGYPLPNPVKIVARSF